MNDTTLKELKNLVQRVTRPVQATSARKRLMREELLAHLLCIFEEEQSRLGNEQAALQRVLERFGDPGELTQQLDQAVPRWNRCRAIVENLGYRPSEAAWRLAVRHFLVMVLVFALWLPGWLLAVGELPYRGPVESQRMIALALAGLVVAAALFNVVLSIVLAPSVARLGRLLAPKSWGRVVFVALSFLLLSAGVLLPLFMGVAVLMVLMACQEINTRRYEPTGNARPPFAFE